MFFFSFSNLKHFTIVLYLIFHNHTFFSFIFKEIGGDTNARNNIFSITYLMLVNIKVLFFSFICAKFIFSENNMNICKLRENKNVQNKVLNVYCTLYNICL